MHMFQLEPILKVGAIPALLVQSNHQFNLTGNKRLIEAFLRHERIVLPFVCKILRMLFLIRDTNPQVDLAPGGSVLRPRIRESVRHASAGIHSRAKSDKAAATL
jgi:hypothetical protein